MVPRSISSTSGQVKSNTGRVGNTAFINQTSSDTNQALIRTMAGRAVELDSGLAESLQVVSYSIGGHFEPHVDYFNSIHGEHVGPCS